MRFLVTGGAGFIGSALIKHIISETNYQVLNIDKLTYAGNLASLVEVSENSRYKFVQGDIANSRLLLSLFKEFKPDIVMHLAAESHVDRSIDGPANFIQTNIVGTYALLEATRTYWNGLSPQCKEAFRFHHISTDEVFGSLGIEGYFYEDTAYDPSSPYSASKASSDHLVRAWYRTYGLPVLITNCSNNYGSYQFVEKLIPLMILNALEGRELPIYGDGQQIRDWLYVEDHARALYRVVTKGVVGETYNIGGNNEKSNLEVVYALCDLLDEMKPINTSKLSSYRQLITFVDDRPGHDQRYAIDASKMKNQLDWVPQETFDTGLRKTIMWYLDNMAWCKDVSEKSNPRQRVGLMIESQGVN